MKIFEVDIVIKRKMVVVAEDETDAQRVAGEYLFVFLEDTATEDNDDADADNAIDVTENPEYQSTIPYGVDDDDPRRNWTVADWRDGETE